MEPTPQKTVKPAVKSKTIYQKLLDVQKEIKPIVKDSSNPYFKSMYFDVNAIIENIKPILNKHGLIVTQPLLIADGKTILQTNIIDSESGTLIQSACYLPDNLKPQEMGSACTYFRRYSLQSILFLQAADDDGNTASGKVVPVPMKSLSSRPSTDPAYAPRPVTPRMPIATGDMGGDDVPFID